MYKNNHRDQVYCYKLW